MLPDWLTRETAMLLMLAAEIIAAAVWLIWTSRKPGSLINLSDVLTGDNGRLSAPKCTEIAAFFTCSWAFVYLFATGHGSFEGLSGFGLIWAARGAANKIINNTTETPTKTEGNPDGT
jgi:hypothetical protein